MNNLTTFERKFELADARRVVGELADLIRPACARLEVCGSIRRGTPTVKDADVVAIAEHNLHTILDSLAENGTVIKALYGKEGNQSTRWGPKYRSMLFQGIKIELWLTSETSWGYIKWLRSGPKEANEYIMAYLIYKRAPIHFVDGDGWYSPGNLWHKPKDKWIAEDKVQLHIPDEDTFFSLLGMPYLPPNERSEQKYKNLMGNNRAHRWPDYPPFVLKAPEMATLVDAPSKAPVFGAKLKAGEMSRMSPLAVNETTAAAWTAQVYREALKRSESQLQQAQLMSRTYPSYARRAEALERDLVMIRGLAG